MSRAYAPSIKRAFDLTFATLGLIASLPIIAVASFMIRINSTGPIFHRGRRIGRHGSEFEIYKLRTMTMGSDSGSPITTAADARITSVGRILRKTKLDELPQFLNVLRGEMSLVGPRPEDPRFVAKYSEIQRRVLNVRPGVTSPAALAFRDEAALLGGSDWEKIYETEILPRKLEMDLEYVEGVSFWSDLRILLSTASALLPLQSTDPRIRNKCGQAESGKPDS